MQSSPHRIAFEDYAKRLFADVHKHKDKASIEIETVFPRWAPNVAISVSLKSNDTVYCGQPTVEKMDDGNYLFVPSVKCAFTDGIEVFGMVDIRNLGETVQYTATKVYVALINDKVGNVYHLFPSMSVAHRRTFVDSMCKTYSTLMKTSDELVPNYILKSVRSSGADPRTAGPSAFRYVVNQLVQRAWDLEQRLVRSQMHAHCLGSEEFENIYRRFKYLSVQTGSGVLALKKTVSVDVTVLRSSNASSNTRVSLNGNKCFDAYCKLFKTLASKGDIAEFVLALPEEECDIIQKREMNESELKTLRETMCYNGFKFNVKREDKIVRKQLKTILLDFFADGVQHLYRYKRRFSFDCGGFNVDLTMVRRGEDKHPVFKPTPFVALEHMRKDTENYEFEIECSVSKPDSATICLHWMDECLRAMRKDTYFFGSHVDLSAYPLLMNEPQTSEVVTRFNALACHGDVKARRPSCSVNNGIGPNVVNITHATYNYVCHHFDDYNILMKTDGLRCLAYVDSKMSKLHLFVQKATYPMSVPIRDAPRSDYILDGELYTRGGCSTYFVFDVYQKGTQHLLTLPLQERLNALTDDIVVDSVVALVIKKKASLFFGQYQELYTNTLGDDDPLQQLKDTFECTDHMGMKANNDGFIIMHTGPLVRDVTIDEEEALLRIHGTKPYIMRLEEFNQGRHSVSSMSRAQQGAYAFCLKWKPEEECTIDFKVNMMEHDASLDGKTRRVRLCSKYTNESELNMFTIIKSLSTGKVTTELCPQTLPNKIQPFQPADVYDYELVEPMSSGVVLMADATNDKLFTKRKELIQDGSIVEMQYCKKTGVWTPLRLRTDKTEPNVYGVALANWKSIFNPVHRPLDWVASSSMYQASELADYYTSHKQSRAFSQLDNIHLLLKQHVILYASRVWSVMEPRARLSVFEVGCGKGTDLFHWNYVHKHLRAIAFYLGTDYDKSGLMRYRGAYYNYLCGNNKHANVKLNTLDSKYEFDALFAQADACQSLQRCSDHGWDNATASNNVSKYKFDFELLRYVLFGKLPANMAFAEMLHGGMVHPSYNLVSCQFAMHYFADEKHSFWKNLNLLLTVDGLFIATVPNGDFITSQLNNSSCGEYIVPIRDANNKSSSVPWYKYENGTSKHTVFFQTPKISRREEPLLLKEKLLRVVQKHFHVVYLDTFANYVTQQSLSIYKTSGETKGIFHEASINRNTLMHEFTGRHAHLAQPVHETSEALRYSKQGHYVVVLCRKNGRTQTELAKLRRQFSSV
jgi:SAM-dependent methyltransferase